MKALVTYFTQTGNTKKIADAIFHELKCDKNILPMTDVVSTEGYDIIFAGFPVWNFGPAEPAKKFIAERCSGKKTALFITHAMSPKTDDEDINKRLSSILEKCREAAADTELTGIFNCQGELSSPIADFLMKSDNEDLKRFGAMRDLTIGYPKAEDISDAAAFAKGVLDKF